MTRWFTGEIPTSIMSRPRITIAKTNIAVCPDARACSATATVANTAMSRNAPKKIGFPKVPRLRAPSSPGLIGSQPKSCEMP